MAHEYEPTQACSDSTPNFYAPIAPDCAPTSEVAEVVGVNLGPVIGDIDGDPLEVGLQTPSGISRTPFEFCAECGDLLIPLLVDVVVALVYVNPLDPPFTDGYGAGERGLQILMCVLDSTAGALVKLLLAPSGCSDCRTCDPNCVVQNAGCLWEELES